MEAALTESQVIEFANKLSIGHSITGITDNNILFFITRTDVERVKEIKCSKMIGTEVQYDKEKDVLKVIVSSYEGIMARSQEEYINGSVIESINMKDKRFVHILLDIIQGKAGAEIYLISDDLSIVSIKPLFISEEGIFALSRAFNQYMEENNIS